MTKDVTRRVFGAGVLAGTGALALQRLRTSGILHDRRKATSRVAILQAESHAAPLETMLTDGLLIFHLDLRGKTVLLKPNFIEHIPGCPSRKVHNRIHTWEGRLVKSESGANRRLSAEDTNHHERQNRARAIMMRSIRILPVLLAIVQAGCYRLPTEEHLVSNFQLQRPLFDTLIKMADEDRQFRRISGGEIPPRGMPVSRYQSYLAIFRTLGIENGLTRDLSPASSGVYILAGSEVPIGGRSRAVGYLYSHTQPAAVAKTLHVAEVPLSVHIHNGRNTVYKRLENRWYLFYDDDFS